MKGRETVGRLALVAVVVLGACSGGDDDGARRDGGSGRDGSTEQDEAGQALRSALLTLDDLPDGWDAVQIHHTAVEPCSIGTPQSLEETSGELPAFTSAFVAPDRAFSAQADAFELLVPAPAGIGQDLLSRAQQLLDTTCASGGEVDGYAYISSEPLQLPVFGDESVARRVTIEEISTGRSQGYNMVYGRHGDLVVAVGIVEPPGETTLIEQLAALAFERAAGLG